MTNDANTSDVTENKEASLAEQHKAWKLNAAAVLHRRADDASLCTTFDYVANEVGLPARERYVNPDDDYYAGSYTGADDVTGEETAEAFEEWKRNTERYIYEQGNAHGIRRVYDQASGNELTLSEVMVEAGFGPGPQDIAVTVKGTFEVTMNVRGYPDDNLIDNIQRYQVQQAVYDNFNTDGVQWKATLASDDK